MSNTVLAIIGAMVSMLTMVGFSVVQLEKMDADPKERRSAPDGEHETIA